MRVFQKSMALFVSWCLVLVSVPEGFAFQTGELPPPPQAAKQSPEQLQQLVAPIALYPDGLVAQILAAATYPEEIVEAEKWMEKHKDLQGEKLAKEVNKQHWDASVKALTQFPAVLANMNQNLAWTSELGDAYVNQQQELNSGDSNHAAAGPTGRKPEDHSPGKREHQWEHDRHSTGDARGGVRASIRSLAGVWVSPGRLSRLVSVSGAFLGWSRESDLDWASALDSLPASAGVGTIGDYDWRGGGRVVYNHDAYISHSRTIVDRNSFRANREDFNRASAARASAGMRSGAFSGFDHGGMARASAFRGRQFWRFPWWGLRGRLSGAGAVSTADGGRR